MAIGSSWSPITRATSANALAGIRIVRGSATASFSLLERTLRRKPSVAAMVIVGGQGSIRGTIIGAVAFTLLPEYLRVNETYRLPAFGLLVILSIIFMPEGINGLLDRVQAQRLRRHATA